MTFRTGAALAALVLAASPASARAPAAPEPAAESVRPLIPVETFTLPNGLRVVFHVDRSDPVAAVLLAAHTGSSRETPGRTGFAHMFEHLFFLDSENLGPGGLDKLTARVGGSGANGFTNNDQTIYLQTVPNDALEKMIWAEADKLGYFINTVTPAVLEKEKQVVKNEKRQRVDNQPYGHLGTVMSNALYPADHPYSWPVIGSLADLDAATLADVKAFHSRWYVPNNATLVIAGDFDPAQAKAWVTKYFSDIPQGAPVERPKPRPAGLSATKRLMHEDGFATLPLLALSWPAAPAYDPDFWPLTLLADLLTDGQDAPLNKAVVEDGKLAGEIDAGYDDGQLAGEWSLSVQAFDGVDLNAVQAAIDAGFARFEAEGVKADALQRARAVREADFYGDLASVLGKAAAIARCDGLTGKPDCTEESIRRLRAVTPEDVMRVYRRYVAGRPHVAASFVPKGQAKLALAGSIPAKVVEEPIVQGAEKPVDAAADRPAERPKTPSSFDRSKEPPAGPAPVVKAPAPWTATLADGVQVTGVEDRELPLVQFQIAFDGGRLREDPTRPGATNLLARMLTRGTRTKTRAEFENALKALGAEVGASAGDERLVITGRTLARNLAPTLALVQEMILEPRLDPAELDLVKADVAGQIADARSRPSSIADLVTARLTWGETSVLGESPLGTPASVQGFTADDLRAFHAASLSPTVARVRLVGAVSQAEAVGALAGLGTRWAAKPLPAVPAPTPKRPDATRVYFYDVPGAKQSVLVMSQPGLRRADPDFYAATATNFVLGGGGFASRLTQQLRESKGYTYGVVSAFAGGGRFGQFVVQSPVRANVTLEAATLMRDIVRDYGATLTAEDVALTRESLSKSRARAFETPGAKLNALALIQDYGLPVDYVARESATLDALTLDRMKALAARYIDTNRMYVVIVGDAATQADRLKALGYGEPVRAAPLAK